MTQGANPPDGTLFPDLLAPLEALALSGPIMVALSGGLDSIVLLHLTHHLYSHRPGVLSAIHVNHQLQPDATTFAALCQRTCDQLKVPLEIVPVHVDVRQGSVEARAREARYRVFRDRLPEAAVLLMAHHGDDQAETLLFRFLRGTGIRGLSGMPVQRPLGRGRLVRPWLEVPRRLLRDQAQACGWSWVEDPTNTDHGFDRNFLRHRILPELRGRWPGLDRRLLATARACSESAELTDLLAQTQFRELQAGANRIQLSGFRDLPAVARRNLLRWWLGEAAGRTLGHEEIRELVEAAADAGPEILAGEFALRRFRDHIYRIPRAEQPLAVDQALVPGTTVRDGHFRICLQAVAGNTGASGLRLAHRIGGEVLRPSPQQPARPLKKWLQEQWVPPWERDRLPLIYRGEGELVAVGDLWCVPDLAAPGPGDEYRLEIRRD